MKMDFLIVPHEELQLADPSPPRRRDWGAPVLVIAALLAAGTAVASRPSSPTQTITQPLA